jgi:hypothetical protein
LLLQHDSREVAKAKPTHRSRVSNGSKFLTDIDGRSATARRMRDLVADLKQHLGGSPSPAQEIVLRRAATLAAWCEAQEAAHLTGEKLLDVQVYTTAVNALRRLIADLGLEAVARDVTPSLARYLADNSAVPAEPEQADAGNGDEGPDGGPDEPAADDPAPAAIAAPSSEPEREPDPPAKVGDVISIEDGRALLQFIEILADKREKWLLLAADGRPLEPHFSREAAEKRARRLIEEGRL